MQAMMPQTQHMLTSDRGRILMLLRSRAQNYFVSSVHELKSFGTDCSKASASALEAQRNHITLRK